MILGIMNRKKQKGKKILAVILVFKISLLGLVTKNSNLNRKTLVSTASLTDTTLKVQLIVVNLNLGKDLHHPLKLKYN